MTTPYKNRQNDLNKLTLKDYFKAIELVISKNNSVEVLTELFSSKPYLERKPYLTRRQLQPIDNRFKQIELVYKEINKVCAIVWNLKVSLSHLKDMFGEPIVHNEPYSNSTVFAFRSKNENIEIIKTQYPEWLTLQENIKILNILTAINRNMK